MHVMHDTFNTSKLTRAFHIQCDICGRPVQTYVTTLIQMYIYLAWAKVRAWAQGRLAPASLFLTQTSAATLVRIAMHTHLLADRLKRRMIPPLHGGRLYTNDRYKLAIELLI
jgi:hypothetical protein